jgi:polysaccharide export outer membrane protein
MPANSGTTDILRAGDKVTITLSGVPDNGYNILVQIPPSGKITLPNLSQSFQAAGRDVGELAEAISEAYRTEKIYSNPHVSVFAETRFINVSGDVRSPSRVPYTPDLTLMTAIISCGGFDEYADRHHVRITRGTQLFQVDCSQILNHPGTDPPVYPGDQIYVPRTAF